MYTILVTGSNGFIGKNLISTLTLNPNIQLITYDIDDDFKCLEEKLSSVDFIVHLAGINRPQLPDAFQTGNVDFTRVLLEAVQNTNKTIPFIFTSSTQATLDNEYGRSKAAAEQLLLEWGKRTGNPIYILRLPNVFGKWCKPFYNSAVATFCYQAAHHCELTINNPDAALSLIYIDDVIAIFTELIQGSQQQEGLVALHPIYHTTVGHVASIIQDFAAISETLCIPTFSDALTLKLFATYTSYQEPQQLRSSLVMKQDQRGYLAEFIKSKDAGQIFISKTHPGVTRGNHWHHTKVEKFLVIQGVAEVVLRQIHGQEVIHYVVSGELLQIIDIPVGYTHAIKNIGDQPLLTLFWANQIFDPNHPDTFFLEV